MKVPPALWRLLTACIALLALVMQNSHAGPQDSTEDIVRQVKAAYIFKFGNYVEWPAEAFIDELSPIIIGVVNEDKVADELTRLAAKRGIGKRPVSIRRMQQDEAKAKVHMLFIGNKAQQPISNWLAPQQGEAVLCITEDPQGIPPGSVINFVLDNNRVRFDVSQPAAERNNLQLSAALLSVARNVHKDYFE